MNKSIQPIPFSETNRPPLSDFAKKVLNSTTSVWFIIAVMGQWLFAYYILAFYGGAAVQGDFEKWNSRLEHHFTSGDFIGNLMIFSHIALAFIITLGGPLQLIPRLRNRFMKFHRWNGRVYVLTALLISVAGLYLIFVRGIVGGLVIGIGNIINATLIMTSAILTWRFAIQKKMEKHRRWALRLFVLASGVWFFRLGFAFWVLIHQGAPGHTDDFTGPFDIALGYGHTLLPLAILELYFWVQRSKNTRAYLSMSVLLAVLSLVMAGAIFAAGMVFWFPLL